MQFGFNTFGVKGKAVAVALHVVIFIIFSFFPLGFRLRPDDSVQDRNSAIICRIGANFCSAFCVMSAFSAYVNFHYKGNYVRDPEGVIKELNESFVLVRIIWMLMSHFFIFHCCRLCVLLGKVVLSNLPV